MSEFILPNLGDGVAQGDVLKVLGQGRRCDQDRVQPVLELETDKATNRGAFGLRGKVTEIKVKPGD
jgi:pyruvate/2-oxoglutarate dehydrogenase complex dihydrolipoamide acyltransferase (E2) component